MFSSGFEARSPRPREGFRLRTPPQLSTEGTMLLPAPSAPPTAVENHAGAEGKRPALRFPACGAQSHELALASRRERRAEMPHDSGGVAILPVGASW